MFNPKYKVVRSKYPFTPGWQIAKRKWYFFYVIPKGYERIYRYKADAEDQLYVWNSWESFQ